MFDDTTGSRITKQLGRSTVLMRLPFDQPVDVGWLGTIPLQRDSPKFLSSVRRAVLRVLMSDRSPLVRSITGHGTVAPSW